MSLSGGGARLDARQAEADGEDVSASAAVARCTVAGLMGLPGCITQGETRDEAVAMARDCIEGFPAYLAGSGEPVPLKPEPADAIAARREVAGPIAA